MVKSERQVIICPNCESEEQARVLFTFPFNTFIHECNKCGYIIMESEWEVVDSQKKQIDKLKLKDGYTVAKSKSDMKRMSRNKNK